LNKFHYFCNNDEQPALYTDGGHHRSRKTDQKKLIADFKEIVRQTNLNAGAGLLSPLPSRWVTNSRA